MAQYKNSALYGKLNVKVHKCKYTTKFLDRLHIWGLLKLKSSLPIVGVFYKWVKIRILICHLCSVFTTFCRLLCFCFICVSHSVPGGVRNWHTHTLKLTRDTHMRNLQYDFEKVCQLTILYGTSNALFAKYFPPLSYNLLYCLTFV